MSDYRVLHLSDLHLSALRPHNVGNWEICLEEIARIAPDLVVIGGDMVLDDPDVEEDQALARAQVGRLGVPWRAVPGNHDVGDTEPMPYQAQAVNEARLARYLAHYETDRWVFDLGAWRVIGLNSLILASDLPAEPEQTAWLEAQLAEWRGKPVALFMHKPLCLDHLEEETVTQTVVTPEGRRRLLATIAGHEVRLVGAGHTHRARTLHSGGLTMVWTPTIGQVNHGFQMPRGGRQRAGWIQYTFRDGGVEWELTCPPRLTPVDVTALSAEYKAMRFLPPHLSTALLSQARIEPVA